MKPINKPPQTPVAANAVPQWAKDAAVLIDGDYQASVESGYAEPLPTDIEKRIMEFAPPDQCALLDKAERALRALMPMVEFHVADMPKQNDAFLSTAMRRTMSLNRGRLAEARAVLAAIAERKKT